jgi:tRNA threonylcarbamoyladenosine biosynthesis protein TsaE
MTKTSTSTAETLEIGRQLVQQLTPGAVVALQGPLGAGKTTLVKGLARGLGIAEDVTSPTFTLISEYESSPPLHHVDLYRINRESELGELGLDELFYGNGITVIEWPEKAGSLLPADTINIRIGIRQNGDRIIQIEGMKHEHAGD